MRSASVCVIAALCLTAKEPEITPAKEPAVTSVFPLGGRQGSTLEAVVRGENLEGAYSAWFDCGQLGAEIKDFRPAGAESKVQEVRLQVAIASAAAPGAHILRLVTPRGVSGPLWFLVNTEPVIAEASQPHASIREAQAVSFPVVVNGKLAERGEVDYYSFEAAGGQALRFELAGLALSNDSSDPQLILYEPTGSWFDPDRGTRLEVADLSRPPPGEQPQITSHRLPRFTRLFERGGRFALEVGTTDGASGPDYSYQLRIVPVESGVAQPEPWGPLVAPHAPGPALWKRRSFTSPMDIEWLQRLETRGAAASGKFPALAPVREQEPNARAAQALEFRPPGVLEGDLGSPGDADWFQFEAKAGDRLAFEIETPHLPPPFFNPRLTLYDSGGQHLAQSIFRHLGGDGDDWIKTPMPKTLFTFDKAGRYFLELRDLTSRFSGPDYAYRIVVRPQIPHVGQVAARGADRFNLNAGETRRLEVTAELEEGFRGEVALVFENLPPGVAVLPGLAAAAETALVPTVKRGGELHRERHLPERQVTTVLLSAAPDAPATRLPQGVLMSARPVAGGRVGAALPAQEILLSVTPPRVEAARKAEKPH